MNGPADPAAIGEHRIRRIDRAYCKSLTAMLHYNR
jgi:hypothetical protein